MLERCKKPKANCKETSWGIAHKRKLVTPCNWLEQRLTNRWLRSHLNILIVSNINQNGHGYEENVNHQN